MNANTGAELTIFYEKLGSKPGAGKLTVATKKESTAISHNWNSRTAYIKDHDGSR